MKHCKIHLVLVMELCLVLWPLVIAAQGDPQVRQAQERLKDAGFDPGPIDGTLGPRTKAALRQYQDAHGLQLTDMLDEPTRTLLMSEGAKPSVVAVDPQAKLVLTTEATPVRSGPNSSNPPSDILPKGTPLEVYSFDEGWYFVRIPVAPYSAWVEARHVTVLRGHTTSSTLSSHSIRLEITIDEDNSKSREAELRRSCEKALRRAGFILVRTAEDPTLSIHATYYYTGCQVRYQSSNELVTALRRIRGTATLTDKGQVFFDSTIVWPKSECAWANYHDFFASSLLVEFAIHGIRRDKAIEAWLGHQRLDASWGSETMSAYKDFARIGEKAIPKLRQVILQHDAYLDGNAALALGAIGTSSAFEMIKTYLHNKPRDPVTYQMCEGLQYASRELSTEILEELKNLYTAERLSPFCQTPIGKILRAHRMIGP